MDSLAKMDICKVVDIINDLLKPFKMRLHLFASGRWEIRTDDDCFVAIIQNNEKRVYAESWSSGNDGLDQIMTIMTMAKKWIIMLPHTFVEDQNIFNNIYYGCTSLEEMLIKKDLIA